MYGLPISSFFFRRAVLPAAAVASLIWGNWSCAPQESSRQQAANRTLNAPAIATTAPASQPSRFPAVNVASLPNAHVVTTKVIAGAQPEGDVAFAALRDM